MKYDKHYSGFYKRFIGLGIMLSYSDTPIWDQEEMIFTLRLFYYKFWIVFTLND